MIALSNLPVLVIFCPLIGALLCPIVSWFNRQAGRWLVTILSGSSLIASALLLCQIRENGRIHYWFGNWEPPYGIEFSVDSMNGVLLVLIGLMGFLSALFGMPFQQGNSRFKSAGYYSILSLLITGLLGMTATGDVFNLYVFLEITSLSGYALIAMGGDKGVTSAFRYLLIGTIGASFYLLGIAFIYGETGTLNMYDMSGLVGPVLESGTTMVAMVFFILGFGIKMALFPLHGWQPAAYSEAHPGAAPLIAGVMGKVPAYAMLRFFYFVFDANRESVSRFLVVVGVMASMGILYGSLKAIQQKDLRRMLAYSSIAQIGYVGIGIAMDNFYGLVGAMLHIINHSFMKSGLFFCIGGIRYRYGVYSVNRIGQLYKRMPKTVVVIAVSALSMVGIPPMAGFFSKWYLALGAVEAGSYGYIAVLIASSLLSAVYFFGLLEHIFMDAEPASEVDLTEGKRELPWSMMLPIILCGLGVVLLGLCNTWFVDLLTSTITEVA
ncbi:monovalent cation/H+ antiporter subunit D family protein [Ihubacter sp. rT4E-8]|uniref:monovalent cation/H+ antiporter subunit D family protein n=1 Tax=unclassified Ihubacter TaxID=2633299 RepID=UPI00137A8C69